MQLEGLITNENSWIVIVCAAAIAVLILVVLIAKAARPLPKKIEAEIRKRKYMSRDAFLESWKESKQDYPGCYVVLIYDKKVILNPMHYDEIYVGQSVNVRKRVFSHFCGRGNGNVYYGLKSGAKIFVIIKKCNRKNLNRAEKELIAYFDATKSLNQTKGGAKNR